MRKLVLLVCMAAAATGIAWAVPSASHAGIIPTWQSESGKIGFQPISNEVSFYRNYDDTGEERGHTLQIVAINSLTIFTDFSFEFTADYNFDMAPGLDRDHYVELSLVKPVTSFVSLNVQRIISSFEPESINQVGVRLVF
jgi:hypothetical protein